MDIIGFDAQINAPKALRRIISKMSPKPVALRKITARPVVRPVKARPVATRPVTTRPVARPVTSRPVATRPSTARPSLMRTNTMQPVASRLTTKYAPAQVFYKTASSATMQQNKPLAIVKPSGQVIKVQNKALPVSKLTQTTNPNVVMSVSPIQRTFMPVDLPYQTPTNKSKIVRIANTPYAYAVNVDMIEPAVDSGAGNYYGK